MGFNSFNILKVFISSNKYKAAVPLNIKNKKFCSFLFKNGFIDSYNIDSVNNYIVLYLSKHHLNMPIRYIKQISKPGHRRYISYRQLLTWSNKNMFFIISSSKGIITSKEAVSKKIGGEILYTFRC